MTNILNTLITIKLFKKIKTFLKRKENFLKMCDFNISNLPDELMLKIYVKMIDMFHGKKCVPKNELDKLKEFLEEEEKQIQSEKQRQRDLCTFTAPYQYSDGFDEIIHECDKDERCLAAITCDGEWGDFRDRCFQLIYEEFEEIYDKEILEYLGSYMYDQAAFNNKPDVCIPVKKLKELAEKQK